MSPQPKYGGHVNQLSSLLLGPVAVSQVEIYSPAALGAASGTLKLWECMS